MTKQFKQILKKVYKSPYFHSIEVKDKYIGFKNLHNVLFTFQIDPDGSKQDKIGFFTAGYVRQWEEIGPTYESEYNTLGKIERAKYDIFYIQQTDNPDFILRQSTHITLN